ncbi:hypothetical protein [Hahella sp. HN01]|uniref:hypothetical protein n=1 Tax=Hahella sp. HN01 TaxID=2847262 RepID=UPI001C1EF8C6|nr:hypothetical protein [Hahella sp. HN01]MBU6953250.1 hypothetical protein [Hahella sp. HN01]
MTIYRIVNNDRCFNQFCFDRDNFLDKVENVPETRKYMMFGFHNLSLKKLWGDYCGSFTPYEGEEINSIPDLQVWTGATLIMSPLAYNALSSLLLPYSECLPVTCGGQVFHLFNCLTSIDADEEKSERVEDNGFVASVSKLEFKPTDRLVFKTRYDNHSSLYCQDQVKQVIEREGLQGIQLQSNLTIEVF